ncbi:MAG TPA: hypothetical protein VM532_12755 [Burkholderiales bacterium]|nr:hypothetical protein [Burkholderiales bacterium]
MALPIADADALASVRVIAMAIPSLVEVCSLCNGKGSRRELYTAGCGMGHYYAMSPCNYCNATGYRYKHTGEPVGKSVVNQIRVAQERDR